MKSKTENLDLESKIMSLLIQFPKRLCDYRKHFDGKYLCSPENRIIYKCIQELVEKGTKVDEKLLNTLVFNHEHSNAKKTETQARLIELFNQVENDENAIPIIFEELKKCYTVRVTLKEFDGFVNRINKSENPIELLKELPGRTSSMLMDLKLESKYHKSNSQDGAELQNYIKNLKENPQEVGLVRFGYKNFDKFLPPISKGSLCIYQARTNTGKSMFLMGTAVKNCYYYGINVMIITIEMSNIDYNLRISSHLSGIHYSEIASGNIYDGASEERERINQKWNKAIKNCKNPNGIDIHWVPSNCTPYKVDEIITNSPYRPDLVVIDYAGDMSSGLPGVGQYDPKSHAEIYSKLKELAGKHNCVIFTAQQTKRGVGKKDISTEDGSWSDIASAKADVMIAIQETEEDKYSELKTDDGKIIIGRKTLTIIKGRNIPRLRTYIHPQFYKMNWYEPELDEPEYYGTSCKNTEKQKKKESVEKTEKSHFTKKESPKQESPKEEEQDIIPNDELLENII